MAFKKQFTSRKPKQLQNITRALKAALFINTFGAIKYKLGSSGKK
jgi:hypothetical protein